MPNKGIVLKDSTFNSGVTDIDGKNHVDCIYAAKLRIHFF